MHLLLGTAACEHRKISSIYQGNHAKMQGMFAKPYYSTKAIAALFTWSAAKSLKQCCSRK